jgi:alpha-glucuronidase
MKRRVLLILVAWLFTAIMPLMAEDGSRLWLRYSPGSGADVRVAGKLSPTLRLAQKELTDWWGGGSVTLRRQNDKRLKQDGFAVKRSGDGFQLTSLSDVGLLYAVYYLLRCQATDALPAAEAVENPQYSLRLLNHWDNLDGSVERGYAGRSLWRWSQLPDTISDRYAAYARANASIGINGSVINNVNASPQILTADYLAKVKSLADIFRPYGIKIYLSVNFASPMVIGGLSTADPLDSDVRAWWKAKAKEIYQLIPDFGGFLVKANSEGQPGPCDYGRTHAEGANMLADALKPYKGIVMWRTFVYSPNDADRAKQAYNEFFPLDGEFRDNVILQVKNGPIDFQPREPYTPLFGTMKRTATMPEFQITQEYLGHANHLAYLAPMWREFYDFVSPDTQSAVAGVTNIGDDTNWCGHHLAQANWYAFGRLAWNPSLTSEQIADEWLRQTFTDDNRFVEPVKQMMLSSREAVVNYMMPLGLHHQFAWGHHYGPEPWCEIPGARPDWLPSYYHKADTLGVGFDRTSGGSNAVGQYPDSLARLYDNADSCPDEYILWFHHLPWSHRMKNGRTLWAEMCYKYNAGVDSVRAFQRTWDSVEPYVDAERFAAVRNKLKIQALDAVWWRDACLLYFQTFSCMPIPLELERPVYELENMKRFKLDIDNHQNAPHGFGGGF